MEKKVYIFGAGFSGATLARLHAEKGNNVTVFEKSHSVGGNCYDYCQSNIIVHKYGPHIFHTSNEKVWEFVNRFTKFNDYKNRVNVKLDNFKTFINFPISFKSIEQIFEKTKATEIIENLKKEYPKEETISILELQKNKNKIIKEFADFIYKNIYENYTVKMWGIKPKDIDQEILKRVKINLNYNDNYFPNDKYQGIPVYGYTNLIKQILNHANIKTVLNYEFENNVQIKNKKIYIDNEEIKNTIIYYSGSIDELFHYEYGELPYRSLNIEFESVNSNNFQPVGVVNYPQHPTMTRITEYKYFNHSLNHKSTIISKEYPGKWNPKDEKLNIRFYPINNKTNDALYEKYLKLAQEHKIIPIGRLGSYKYFDMDDAIANSMEIFSEYE